LFTGTPDNLALGALEMAFRPVAGMAKRLDADG